MQHAGSASWRFAEGIEQLPLVALFVRDAGGLDVPANRANPPRLDGSLPDHSALLDSERRATAGPFWTGWWQAVVAQGVRQHQGTPAGLDQRAWFRQRADEHRAVFDPPELTSLADRPALREVVRATFEEALRWADARRRTLLLPPEGRHGQFDYDMTVRWPSRSPAGTGSAPARFAPAPWYCPSRETGGNGLHPELSCAR